MKPDGVGDSIKTIITSMVAVLTVSMALRIILSVRGSLEYGGNFSLSAGTASSSRTTHVAGARSANPSNLSAPHPHTYTLDDLRPKAEGEWGASDADKSSMPDDDTVVKTGYVDGMPNGVKITIDKEIGYDQIPHAK